LPLTPNRPVGRRRPGGFLWLRPVSTVTTRSRRLERPVLGRHSREGLLKTDGRRVKTDGRQVLDRGLCSLRWVGPDALGDKARPRLCGVDRVCRQGRAGVHQKIVMPWTMAYTSLYPFRPSPTLGDGNPEAVALPVASYLAPAAVRGAPISAGKRRNESLGMGRPADSAH